MIVCDELGHPKDRSTDWPEVVRMDRLLIGHMYWTPYWVALMDKWPLGEMSAIAVFGCIRMYIRMCYHLYPSLIELHC